MIDLQIYIETAKNNSSTDSAHDFSHVARVVENAKQILETDSEAQHADTEVVLVACLLHELFNYPKNHPDSARSGDICAERAREVMTRHGFPVSKRACVAECIADHSFSKGIVPKTLEGKILQDADRLDAVGAIGIARCFATGGSMGAQLYSFEDPFCIWRDPDDKTYSVDHFYRKLLHLRDTLHTETARQIALERTRFMRTFLDQLGLEIGVPRL